MDSNSNKTRDTEKIVAYIGQHGDAVHVYDIKQHSGADPVRVYSILFELEQCGIIETVEATELGAPLKVRKKGAE